MRGKRRVAWLAAVVVAALTAPVAAFDGAALERLLAGQDCRGCDLSGADLQDLELSGRDLRGADLTGAALDMTNFTGANLAGADLSRATAAFALFVSADLSGARQRDFQACYDQDLTDARLRGADLTGAVMCATRWLRADLSGAILNGADLTHAIGLTVGQLDLACGDTATRLFLGDYTIPPCPLP